MFENFFVMFCVFGVFEHCTKIRQQKVLTGLNGGGKLHPCSLVFHDILTRCQIVPLPRAGEFPRKWLSRWNDRSLPSIAKTTMWWKYNATW